MTNSELIKSVVESDEHITQVNNGNIRPIVRRSYRIRNFPSVSYSEYDIPDDWLMSSKSLVCSIPHLYGLLHGIWGRPKFARDRKY